MYADSSRRLLDPTIVFHRFQQDFNLVCISHCPIMFLRLIFSIFRFSHEDRHTAA